MPELPDLQVVAEFLAERMAGVSILSVQVRRPIVLRNLMGGDVAEHLVGRSFVNVTRRAKSLLMPLDGGVYMVVQPMLAGRVFYGTPRKRYRKRDVLVLGLENGAALWYHDVKDMGKVYVTGDLARVPGFAGLGPDALDPELTMAAFCQRLAKQRGEIKRVLTRQSFVAGIGNAYADEICWQAGIYPFRRRSSLGQEEMRALYMGMREVLTQAVQTLRTRVGQDIDLEIRDFLAVHGKAGQPCPRCGAAISEVKRERRMTHFCRTCQPGLLIRQ